MKEESSPRTVVNISDTVSPSINGVRNYILISDSMSPRRTFQRNIASDDDEVTSPTMPNFPSPRRRLFDEESVTGALPASPTPQPNVARRQPRAPKNDRAESSCGSSSAWSRLFKH